MRRATRIYTEGLKIHEILAFLKELKKNDLFSKET